MQYIDCRWNEIILATPNYSSGTSVWVMRTGHVLYQNPWRPRQAGLHASSGKSPDSSCPKRFRPRNIQNLTRPGNHRKKALPALAALCKVPVRLSGLTFQCHTAHTPIDILDIEYYNGFGHGWPLVFKPAVKGTPAHCNPVPQADGYVGKVINAYENPR